jgi:hypothetical protein
MLAETAGAALSQGLPVVAGQQLYSDEMATTQCNLNYELLSTLHRFYASIPPSGMSH